jgi:hypothetical protein
MIEMADVYRAMADQAIDRKLQPEFGDRAGRFEIVLQALRQKASAQGPR